MQCKGATTHHGGKFKIPLGEHILLLRIKEFCTIGELRKGTYNQFKCPDGSHYIDHVIAKPNPSMAIDYFSVIYDFFADAEHQVPLGYVSDHFAVVCDLRFDTEQDFSNYYQNRRASDE